MKFWRKFKQNYTKTSKNNKKYVIIWLTKGRTIMANTKKNNTNNESNKKKSTSKSAAKSTTTKKNAPKANSQSGKKVQTAKKSTSTKAKTNVATGTKNKTNKTSTVKAQQPKKKTVSENNKTVEKKNKTQASVKSSKSKVVEKPKEVKISKEEAEKKESKVNDSVMKISSSEPNNMITIVMAVIVVVAIIVSCLVTSSKGNYNSNTNQNGSNYGSSVEEESSKIKDSEKKDLTSINIDEYLSLLDGSEAAVIYIGRPTCSHCQIQKPIMEHIVYKYDVKIHYLNTDELDDDGISKLQSSDEYFSEGWGTPLTLVVKDGSIKDKASGESSTTDLVEMFKKYDLIKE